MRTAPRGCTSSPAARWSPAAGWTRRTVASPWASPPRPERCAASGAGGHLAGRAVPRLLPRQRAAVLVAARGALVGQRDEHGLGAEEPVHPYRQRPRPGGYRRAVGDGVPEVELYQLAPV